MTDTGIYIIESDASVSGSRHLGLLIVKDGISTFIDGGQSKGFLIDAEEVPVDELQNFVWGNLIINIQTVFAVPTQEELDSFGVFGAVKLNVDPLDVDQKAQIILNELASINELQTHDTDNDGTVDREYFDYNIGYNPLGSNSNSVVNSLLSLAGINLSEVVENLGNSEASEYVGRSGIIDSGGDDIFTLFDGRDYIVRDNSGGDTYIIESGVSADFVSMDESTPNTIVLKDVNPDTVEFFHGSFGSLVIRAEDGMEVRISNFFDFNFFNDGDVPVNTVQIEYNGLTLTKDISNLQSTDLFNLFSGTSFFNLPGGFRAFLAQFEAVRTVRDPLVVDLDMNGFAGLVNNQVYFDMDADGSFAELARFWVAPGDGFIVWDANGNDRADDGAELFGNGSTDAWVRLAEHDDNSDGVIDSSDAIFTELNIWRDANSDGITQNDEWFELSDFNITSVNIPASGSAGSVSTDAGDILVRGVTINTEANNTRFNGDVDIKFETLFLPEIRGFSTLPDLRIAMSLDGGVLQRALDLAAQPLADTFENFLQFRADFTQMMPRREARAAVL